MDHELECERCGARFDPGDYSRGCPDCRERGTPGRLVVTYDADAVPDDPLGGGRDDMWRYRGLLPLLPDEPTTMGEGRTPLVSAGELSGEVGADVWIKNETANPTWSYKDRLNSLLISNVVELGRDRIATASTGNHGASTAAYARRAGVDEVIVLLPHSTDRPNRLQVRAYGAHAAVTDHEGRGDVLAGLVDLGWFPTVNVTEPHTGLPYAFEAYKTIAFEIVEDRGVPDAVVAPVGSGDGLFGIWKGFRELHDLGIVDQTPRMIGAQSEERAPLLDALAGGDPRSDPDSPEPITTSTMSAEIGTHAVGAIEASGGTGYALSRADVERAIRDAGREGVYVEPASALSVAAVREAVEDGGIDAGEEVVCLATGAGVKWPDHTESAIGDAPTIEPSIEALAGVVPFALD